MTTAGLTAEDVARLQAEEHPVIREEQFASLPERVLHAMHVRAYDEAVSRAQGRDVLDLGCNSGYGTLRLAAVARSAVGVDVNASAIEAARMRPGAEAATFHVIDGVVLPFPDTAFDLVASFQVIEHIDDPGPYLAEIARVLRPDGVALLTTPNAAIRLDPGMTPWNRFHVREYRAAELPAVLAPYFESVEVLGMQAPPAIAAVERARVDAARRRVRARLAAEARTRSRAAALARSAGLGSRVRAVVRAIVPAGVRRLLRGMVGTPAVSTIAPAEAPVATISDAVTMRVDAADFWYSPDDADDSLDLLAVCSRPRRPAAS
ncbi:MAG TPA: class I SAM-dependent methyltransferase [Candidatus Limnocylindrales bacterium]|nr:class I SAM-dependent methyltransferase [Candidatus Limnocylindrales bacterium]